jgi:hypothetical protein
MSDSEYITEPDIEVNNKFSNFTTIVYKRQNNR